MSLKEYVKRGLRFIVKGVPVKNVTASIVTLAPNDLLKDRCALVTGGTSGIGFCIAKAFLDSGTTVIITGRDEQKLKTSCSKLNDLHKDKIFGVILDNTKVETFENTFHKAVSLISGRDIDILVNNAGVLGGHIKNATVSEYDTVMNTNLRGTFFFPKPLVNT